jgi:nucleoside phosphorylase
MNLLVFAHRGEAQYFLNFDNYQSVDAKIHGLFKNKKNYLLITGEGFESINESINLFLPSNSEQISKVINLGIAGALDKNLKLDSVHSIRNAFVEDGEINLKSLDSNAKLDCISARDRVLDSNYAKRLAKYAAIVDMELFAIAESCNKNNIPFISFKLISDYAGNKTDSKAIIKKSKMYSEKLYNYYIYYLDQ